MTSEEKLPPLKEVYKLTDAQQRIANRFLEEMIRRLKAKVTLEVYVENFLIQPSIHADTITFKLTAGN